MIAWWRRRKAARAARAAAVDVASRKAAIVRVAERQREARERDREPATAEYVPGWSPAAARAQLKAWSLVMPAPLYAELSALAEQTNCSKAHCVALHAQDDFVRDGKWPERLPVLPGVAAA